MTDLEDPFRRSEDEAEAEGQASRAHLDEHRDRFDLVVQIIDRRLAATLRARSAARSDPCGVATSPVCARQRHPRLLHTPLKVPWQHGHTHWEMNVALTIKNAEVERLATEIARLTGESKTQAVKVALEERRRRLTSGIDPQARAAAALEFMEREIWAHVPAELRGQPHDSARDDAIVGYGPDGLPR